MKKVILATSMIAVLFTSCDKNKNEEPDNDDNQTTTTYDIPETYDFKNASGLSTVSYGGQTDRLNQLREMVTYMKTANSQVVNAQQLKDMFANTNDDGNGHFTFTSSKQLKSKCFSLKTFKTTFTSDKLLALLNSVTSIPISMSDLSISILDEASMSCGVTKASSP